MKICDFCGKSQEQVRRMITAVKADICGECVMLCMDVLLSDISQYEEINFPEKIDSSNTIQSQ